MTINLEYTNNAESIENTETYEHLTLTERYILTYIKFRTNNGREFFGSNENIAQNAGCTVHSAKTMVNKLIRFGYLEKSIGIHSRRTLALTNKPFLPLDGVNMSNKEKSILKQDVDNFERMEKQYAQDITALKRDISDITADRDRYINLSIILRDILLDNGFTQEKIENLVAIEEGKKLKNGFSENQNYKISMPEQSKTIDDKNTSNIKPETHTEVSFNPVIHSSETINHSASETLKDDPESVINEILAKFKVPEGY